MNEIWTEWESGEIERERNIDAEKCERDQKLGNKNEREK